MVNLFLLSFEYIIKGIFLFFIIPIFCLHFDTNEYKSHLTTKFFYFNYFMQKIRKDRQAIKVEVEKMLEAGVIRKSRSPWVSPVVMVSKKDGTRRFCVVYRKLNKITHDDSVVHSKVKRATFST